MDAQLAKLDAVGQADLVRRGELSAADLVSEAIERIEAINPVVNAVVYECFDEARKLAAQAPTEGLFPGVPTLVKDVVWVQGQPCYLGSQLLKEAGLIEQSDSDIVQRLRRSGALIVGRANAPEFAGSISTEPVAFGPTRNPWDLDRSAGGSSGGSAAAVASGMVPFAHGSDGGGSVRIPASLCGLVGLKPSRGLISAGPEGGDLEGVAVHSMITRSVRDTAAALDALHGPLPGDSFQIPGASPSFLAQVHAPDRPLRIGYWAPQRSFPFDVDPACVEACSAAARILESLGHHLEPSYPSALDEGTPDSFFTLATAIFARQVSGLEARLGRPIREHDVEPTSWVASVLGRQLSAVQLQEASTAVRICAHRFASWWAEGYDLLLTPTLAVRAYPLGSLQTPTLEVPFPDPSSMVPFSAHFNISGLPAVTLPTHRDHEGLPVGIQLGAPLGREDVLLQVAAQMEEAAPWSDRWAPNSIPRLV